MTARSESRVIAGLNDYRFVVSLHVQHPSISPDDITSALRMTPRSAKNRGERRATPSGKLLEGTYDVNHWSADIEIASGHDVSEFLDDLIERQISHAMNFTRQIDDTGGGVKVFVGLFAKRCCDFEIPATTLRRLGEAGIAVRLDYYSDKDDAS